MPIDLVSQLFSAAIRALGLGLVAFVSLLLFRIQSSAARHATWTIVLVGMLLQIPLGMVVPAVPLKTLPPPPAPIQPRMMESARISAPAETLAPAGSTRTGPKGRWRTSGGTVTSVYLAISILLFARMTFGCWRLHRILRDAKPLPNLGPGIFESALFVAPGSVGCFRTMILLPRAWKDWDAVKLRVVLAHETAHIRRRDWLIRIASHVNVCIFWFHPLAWWVERELARLAEEACDDVALSEVEYRGDYAATLLDIAHKAAADRGVLNWRVIWMAKEPNVIRRVNRILNPKLQVPKPLGRFAWLTLFACSLPVIYLSAAVKLASVNRDSTMLEHPALPALPFEGARQSPLPEQKSSKRIAQEALNQPLRQAPPSTPPRREDAPITICILIDKSGSMRGKGAAAKAAALALVRASNPHDEVCIVGFNDEVFNGFNGEVFDGLPYGKLFTSDIEEMEDALTHIDSRGGKAMRDAVRMSMDLVEQTAHNDRKVLVLVTEGNDTSSTVTQEQLLSRVKNSRVPVYCIGLLSENDPGRAGAAKVALGKLAEASGGLDYYPKDLAEVESISPEIANEVRKQ
jgi:Mg-chelatase subunit ChlD